MYTYGLCEIVVYEICIKWVHIFVITLDTLCMLCNLIFRIASELGTIYFRCFMDKN